MKLKYSNLYFISYGDPSNTKLPSHNIITLSNRLSILDDGECIVDIIVIPLSFNYYTVYIIDRALVESRPVVGSSRNSKFGFYINSIPIFTLFFSPPEIPHTVTPPTRVSAQLYNPNISIKSYTRSSISY